MARNATDKFLCFLLSVAALTLKFAPGCLAIDCYVCDSTSQIGCAEFLTDTSLLEPQSCDNVQNAQYCVKMTQVFEVGAIDCYQCDGITDLYCGERFNVASAERLGIVAQPCSDIDGAQYCVKATGLFGGQLGTKRFCSSRSFGDYCEWVKRPGDPNTYQACLLTCSSSACNAADSRGAAKLLVAMATTLGVIGWLRATR